MSEFVNKNERVLAYQCAKRQPRDLAEAAGRNRGCGPQQKLQVFHSQRVESGNSGLSDRTFR